MSEAEQQPVEEFTKVESIFVRGRNCLLLRADFSPIFVDYYLHLMQHGLRNDETEDTVLKKLLAYFTLHLVSRPWQEYHAWTFNVCTPRLANYFISGSSLTEDVVGRAFREGVDVHTSTAATVFGVPEEEVTSEMRKRAKAVNFGIMYGIGAFSLSDDIGVSVAEAQGFINRYLAGYPRIDAYLKEVIEKGYEQGYVTTVLGRRRYIPELSASNKMQQKFGERVAMTSPIQGTAADVIKIAMVRVHRALQERGLDARLILQVHDELLLEAHHSCAEEARRLLKEEMEHAMTCAVPLDVDIHVGRTWFDAK